MKKIAIMGPIGVGKTTLVNRLLAACFAQEPVYGFRTRKIDTADRAACVYIFAAADGIQVDEAHCLAERLGTKAAQIHTNVFETLGVELLSDIPESGNGVVLMDEIGFLEYAAEPFAEKIKAIFHGHYTILSVIKPMQTPLLDAIRNHPEVTVITLTEENRESQFQYLSTLLKG